MVRGLPGYESVGKTDAQIWPADLAAEYRANDKQVIATKKPLNTLEHYFQLRGKKRYMAGNKFPIFDRTGAIALVGGAGVDITERIEAEEALRESEERFRELAENIDEVFWLSDLKHATIFYVSPAYEKLWGRSCNSLYASPRSWMDAIHPEDRARVVEVLDDHELQSAPNMVYRVIRPDGSTRWVHARGFPVRDENGAVVRIAGIAADITERKQAEEALRKSERVLREAESLGHTGSWEHNLVTGEIFNTGEQLRLFFGDDRSKGASFEDYTQAIHPDDRESVMRRHAQLLAEGGPRDIEYRVVWPDGSVHVLFGRATVVRDELGQAVRTYGTNLDVTERRRAEEAVRRSEEHLRLVIDTIPTMAWTSQPDGVVDFINQRWLDYAGLTLEQYLKDPMGTVHPDDETRVVENWGAARMARKPYEDEMRLRGGDGEYRWFLVRSEPLRDAQGNVVKWYGSSIDIEDRKQAEEKLRHSEVQLAQAQRLAHIGSWDWDLRTNAVTWSDELYHIFGLQPGTISVAGEVDRFIHPDDLDLGWDTVKRAVASKEPYDYYHRILRPDGTERIARSRGSIMSDERGEPIKVFGATQDVTELKRAEERLKATSAQLRALSANLQSAREEESTRIAREIHDQLGGNLTSLRWSLEEIRDVTSEAGDPMQLVAVREKIEAMVALTRTTLDIVRRLASELRPMALDELGLVDAIEW